MNWKLFIATAILFYLLTPGLYVSIPQDGSLDKMAMVHGIIFAVLYMILINHFLAPYLA